jgi:hypothetical protein
MLIKFIAIKLSLNARAAIWSADATDQKDEKYHADTGGDAWYAGYGR